MNFISYKPFEPREISEELENLGIKEPEFKNTIQHTLIFVMDEPSNSCRWFLKCLGPYKVRSPVNTAFMATYGIYGTEVLLYDISKPNLEKWAGELQDVFFRNREDIRKMAEEYRREHPDGPKNYLDDDFTGQWGEESLKR